MSPCISLLRQIMARAPLLQLVTFHENMQEEPVLPRVPFASCLDRWGSTGEIDDYFSASLGRRTSGLHRTRMASFPPYLMVQLKRSVLPNCTAQYHTETSSVCSCCSSCTAAD